MKELLKRLDLEIKEYKKAIYVFPTSKVDVGRLMGLEVARELIVIRMDEERGL
ncbi:hypothetical protein LCGC14_0176330 [marine sediment metagenome]|uniref:Uncharacterized protein n=1 Tax=marine sediment metagenome TaxID=412755 RepID=A0A0F9UVN5_9ZZZZ